MDFVVTMLRAVADSRRRRFSSVEESRDLLPAAKDSARAMISFADAMRASRSEKAVPITRSLFLRSSLPRDSRPAIPTTLGRSESVWPSWPFGTR